jgi:hypothetical protein
MVSNGAYKKLDPTTESAKSDFYITPLEKNINFLLKQAEGKKQHF